MARTLNALRNSTALHNGALLNDDAGASLGRVVHLDNTITGDGNANTLTGTSGDDTIHGNGGNDTINMQQGGNDTVYGDAGNDTINAGASMTTADHIDGGTGYNVLNINGYSGAYLDIGASTMTNIQKLTLGAGHNYSIYFNDANIAAGVTLTVDASALGSGNTTNLNFSEETNGNCIVYGSAGNDKIYGGSHSNILHLENGGTDTVQGDNVNKGGTYTFYMGASLDASDVLDPEYGTGSLFLNGDYTAAHALFATDYTFRHMTAVNFGAGHSYKLVLSYSNVFNYSQTVDASSLGAGDSVYYDASQCFSATGFTFKGGAGNDTFLGSSTSSIYSLELGGNDVVTAGSGADIIYMGAHLNAADIINGGAGNDSVDLNGDYSAQVVFNYNTMQGVENLALEGTHNYNLKLYDNTVASGQTLVVNGSTLGSGILTLDASGETDGTFIVYSGAGADTISTGGGSDVLHLEKGGNDILHAGGGNDAIYLKDGFNSLDQIDGGAGSVDVIYLDGNYAGRNGITMNASTMTNVEQIYMATGFNYSLKTVDANVVANQSLYVDSSALIATYSLNFNGAAETDGTFAFAAGAGNDTLAGGAGNDAFYLSKGGNDTVNGGGGNDSFTFTTAFSAADQVDGGAGTDTVSLNGDYIFANALTFGATTMVNVETLNLATAHSYTIAVHDATLTSGQTMTVNGATLGVANILNFDATGETNIDASYVINAGASDDTLKGGAGNDVFGLTVGGNDTASGGDGNDTFNFGAAFNASDSIDGGVGSDTVTLSGNYAAGVTFNAATMVNVETLTLGVGSNYKLTTNDATVAAGQMLTVNASALNTLNNLTFNGAAETNGNFTITAGAGSDSLTGGAGADIFQFAAVNLTSGDTVNGGIGAALDRLTFTTAGTVAASAFTNVSHVEQIVLTNGTNNITLSDALVGSADDNHLITVFASSGNGADTIDASAVTTAANHLTINAGGGNDTLTGGAGADNLIGGAGADLLTGNGGADHFIYAAASESSSTNYDTLAGIDFSSDRIDITHAVSAIDAAVSTGTLSIASFDTDLASAVNGHLNPYDAMLFTASAGGLNGQTFLVVDLNGSAGYQANADLVFHITGQTGVLATTDFI